MTAPRKTSPAASAAPPPPPLPPHAPSCGWKVGTAVAVVFALMGGLLFLVMQQNDAALEASTDRLIQAQEQITALEAENQALAQHIEALLQEVGDQGGTIESLRRDLDNSFQPQEIGSPVDFPIVRGMARAGDTLSAFAQREKTTPEVLRALNPWLPAGGNPALENRQILWIPRP